MDEDKIAKRVKEIAEEIKGRRMIFTDQEWPDDTGDQFDKVYQYAYYLYAGVPVRIYNHPKMRWAGAEKLNFRTGQFDYDNDVRIRMEYDMCKDQKDTDEVRSKEEFYKKCDEYMANYTPQRIAEEEVMRERNEAWMRERMAKKKAEIDGK